MRKKEKIAVIATLVIVAVVVLVAVFADKEQQRQRAETKAAGAAQTEAAEAKRTYGQGETVRVSSDDENAFAFAGIQGSMDVTFREAELYGSYEATGLPTDDGHFFGLHNSPGFDSFYFLVCKIDVANIDAKPINRAKSGDYDFTLSGPKANAASFVYFDGSNENCSEGAGNCFSVDPGEEKTLTVCWQIPQNDGSSNLPESVDVGFLSYVITLTPEDCR